jgi:hypothetical protein
MRLSTNHVLGQMVGFNRHTDLATADEGGEAVPRRGTAKATILVTHLPNWRNGIGVVSTTYGGARPAWENVRMVHGVMEAAKWAAMQANTPTNTYFRDGPIKWVWPDEITERDLR